MCINQLLLLDFLALSGFIFLMFLTGLEIDMDQVTLSFPRKRFDFSNVSKNPMILVIVYFSTSLELIQSWKIPGKNSDNNIIRLYKDSIDHY